VSSFAALQSAVADNTPRIVNVSGTLSGSGMVKVGSNKTIRGLNGATLNGFGLDVNGWTAEIAALNDSPPCDPGLVGADGTKPVKLPGGVTGPFNHVSNVIIQNLTFSNADDDALNVGCYAHHVWLDHNTINKPYDGSIDIKRGADFVTVSWNRLIEADKAMLLGHETSSDQALQSAGRLHVTYHHNLFDNTVQRHPRVRYGTTHVFNNYAFGTHMSYFVGVANNANIYVEANNIAGTNNACKSFENASTSHVTFKSDNIVLDRKGRPLTCDVSNDGKATVPPYAYSADTTSSVPASVQNGAGAGKVVF
jgi:pectate lyase